MDTDDICSEIPCYKLYYFTQDTVNITKIPEIEFPITQSINYPNPFSHRTTIAFPNPKNEPYTLKIYSVHGRLMKIFGNIRDDEIDFYKGNLPPGIYYYQLSGKKFY
jgi:hypothetical protein